MTTEPLMVTVAVRSAVALLAGRIVTVPVPVPEDPDETVNHDALELAVHEQVVDAITEMVASAVVRSMVMLVGVKVTGQPATAACVTVTTLPATVKVADRGLVPVYVAAVAVNEPLPLRPALTVSHEAELLVVQAQPDVVVTLPEADPPLTPRLMAVGVTEKLHAGAGCVTVTVLPATVNVAEREVGPVLAVAVAVNEPPPVRPAVTVSHEGSELLVVQAQADVVLTVPAREPPATAIDMEVGVTVKEQFAVPAACVMVTALPAAVNVAERWLVVVFAPIAKATVPLPLPDDPLVIVSQDWLLLAVQAHPDVVVTDTLPFTAPAPTLAEVGDTA
jgi:hypothetical protein